MMQCEVANLAISKTMLFHVETKSSLAPFLIQVTFSHWSQRRRSMSWNCGEAESGGTYGAWVVSALPLFPFLDITVTPLRYTLQQYNGKTSTLDFSNRRSSRTCPSPLRNSVSFFC